MFRFQGSLTTKIALAIAASAIVGVLAATLCAAILVFLEGQRPQGRPVRRRGDRRPDQRLRVLVVDDHPTNLKVVGMILGEAGAEVVGAENGQAGVELFA